MTLSLISLVASDDIELPGLLYTPEHTTKKAAIWLHGMGDSGIFYSPKRMNSLGSAFTSKDIALLTFNNRGAYNSKKLKKVDQILSESPEDNGMYQGGAYYEKIIDCIKDIDGALNYLKEQDFSEFYMIGHSTGANKICVYNFHKKHNPFSKYVLAGPGDDTGLYFDELGNSKFRQAIAYARKLVAQGQPLKIMPRYSGMHPFSAQSALDILDPDGLYNTFPFYEETTKRIGKKQLFQEYRLIDIPMLVIFGEKDEFTYTAGGTEGAIQIMKKFTSPMALKNSQFSVVKGTDHGFHGAEETFAEDVAAWLAV